MTYIELKQELTALSNIFLHIPPAEFDESLAFEHFKTFFELKDSPHYTLLQGKNNPDFNTTEDMWYLAYQQNDQLVVLDIADESTICDEFYQLIVVWYQGHREIKTNKI